jgi:RNA polymerase sigma-70 factor (ECF subfamily)
VVETVILLHLAELDGLREELDPSVLDLYIRRIAAGDTRALENLYHETHTSVYAYVISVLKNIHDAEDVLHDCYLAVHSAAANYSSSGKPMAWIITIAKNLCLMKLRERKKKAEVEDEDFFINAQYNEDSRLTPEDAFILNECMNELSDEERQIVVLHVVSGFKHREIASFLNMALPTVLSKYHRALKKLKNSLSKGEREE